MTFQKWGALASFVVAATFFASPLIVVIYLTTPYPSGRVWYQFSDFLSGPLWAASLMMVVFALRERVGERAPRRMSIVLLAATLSTGLLICAAIIRSVHRDFQYFNPTRMDETSLLLILNTLSVVVPAVVAAGRHFLGWMLLALASVGWTTLQLPRGMSALFAISGVLSLLAYLWAVYPEQPADVLNGLAWLMFAIPMIWLGIMLWTAETTVTQAPIENHAQA